MLKISPKQEKIRRFLYSKNNQFYIYKVTKLFLVRYYSLSKNLFGVDLYNLYFSFSSSTKTRSICLLTGRSRSVYRLFKMSRLQIRAYSKYGYFVGLSKTNW
jgi:ribosomal protein S14